VVIQSGQCYMHYHSKLKMVGATSTDGFLVLVPFIFSYMIDCAGMYFVFSRGHQHRQQPGQQQVDSAAQLTCGGASELLDKTNAAIQQLTSSLASQAQQQQDIPRHHPAADCTSGVNPSYS